MLRVGLGMLVRALAPIQKIMIEIISQRHFVVKQKKTLG